MRAETRDRVEGSRGCDLVVVVELDRVRSHRDLSTSVRTPVREASKQRAGSVKNSSTQSVRETYLFFLFFSFVNPLPLVTIKSALALAP